jgi:hypothetical protein
MTGPEHYLEAERYLSALDGVERDENPDELSIAREAQVHATLALAAATALGHDQRHLWHDVAGST